MPEIDRYRPEDQRGVEALYRRVFGADAAAASRLRWDWQYRRNPNNPKGTPLLWVVREGPTIIGHYATIPVRLSLLNGPTVSARLRPQAQCGYFSHTSMSIPVK